MNKGVFSCFDFFSACKITGAKLGVLAIGVFFIVTFAKATDDASGYTLVRDDSMRDDSARTATQPLTLYPADWQAQQRQLMLTPVSYRDAAVVVAVPAGQTAITRIPALAQSAEHSIRFSF